MEQKKGHKITFIIVGIVVVVIIILAILMNKPIKYNLAYKEYENKNYNIAIEKFEDLGNYKESKTILYKCKKAIMEEKQNRMYQSKQGKIIVVAPKIMKEVSMKDYTEWRNLSKVLHQGTMLGLKNDGTVVSYGFNGKEYDVSKWNNIVDIGVDNDGCVGLQKDGTVLYIGNNSYKQMEANEWKNVKSICVGGNSVFAITNENKVLVAGASKNKFLDLNNWENIEKLYTHQGIVVGIKKDGTVVAVGCRNNMEQDVLTWNNIVDISIDSYNIFGLKEDGTVVATGEDKYNKLQAKEWTNIVKIKSGLTSVIGLKDDGSVVTTSDNIDTSNWNDIVQIDTPQIDGTAFGLKADGTMSAAYCDNETKTAYNEINNISNICDFNSYYGSRLVLLY